MFGRWNFSFNAAVDSVDGIDRRGREILFNMYFANILFADLCRFHFISFQLNSTQLNSTQLNSTQLNSTQLNSTQLNSTQLNSTQLNSTQLNSTQLNSIQLNSTQFISIHPSHQSRWTEQWKDVQCRYIQLFLRLHCGVLNTCDFCEKATHKYLSFVVQKSSH